MDVFRCRSAAAAEHRRPFLRHILHRRGKLIGIDVVNQSFRPRFSEVPHFRFTRIRGGGHFSRHISHEAAAMDRPQDHSLNPRPHQLPVPLKSAVSRLHVAPDPAFSLFIQCEVANTGRSLFSFAHGTAALSSKCPSPMVSMIPRSAPASFPMSTTSFTRPHRRPQTPDRRYGFRDFPSVPCPEPRITMSGRRDGILHFRPPPSRSLLREISILLF